VSPLERLRESPYLRGRLPHFTLNRLIDALGWNLFSPFWLKHIQNQGAPITAIGGVESLYNLFLLLQLVGGQLSDSIGRKKMMTVSYALSIAGIVLVLGATTWVWLLVPVALWGLADSLIDPVTGVYFAEIAGGEEKGTAFSLLSFTWFLPGLFAPTAAALILERFGFKILAWILMTTEVAAFVILLVWIPETLKDRKPVSLRTMAKTIVDTIRPKPGLAAFYAVALLDALTYGLFAPFLVIIFTDNLGYTELQSGILLNVVTLMITLLLLPVGRLIDAFSSRKMITVYGHLQRVRCHPARLKELSPLRGGPVPQGRRPQHMEPRLRGLPVRLGGPGGARHLLREPERPAEPHNAPGPHPRDIHPGQLRPQRGILHRAPRRCGHVPCEPMAEA